MQSFGLARIGRDAEVRFIPQGDAVCNLSLAFTYGKKGADGRRQTQWVDGTLFGKRAETLAPYLLKGTSVTVTLDEVHIQTFTKGDGTPGFKLAGKISFLEFAGSPPQQNAQAPAPAPAPRPAASRAPAAPPVTTGYSDMDDDQIPF